MARVRFVLVRPEKSGNVGATARAIANAGLEGLDLVRPGDWRTVEAWRMAWRAENILEQARVFEDLDRALAEAHYVAGMAGRSGMRVEPITVREMAAEIAALEAEAPAAVVLGCESKGLSEEELSRCQRRVRIPAHSSQSSLNLAQAVMVAAYEIFLAQAPAGGIPLKRAPNEEVEKAFSHFKQALLDINFLPRENPEARFVEWRELFGRAGLTEKEVRILLALARRIRNTARIAGESKTT